MLSLNPPVVQWGYYCWKEVWIFGQCAQVFIANQSANIIQNPHTTLIRILLLSVSPTKLTWPNWCNRLSFYRPMADPSITIFLGVFFDHETLQTVAFHQYAVGLYTSGMGRFDRRFMYQKSLDLGMFYHPTFSLKYPNGTS